MDYELFVKERSYAALVNDARCDVLESTSHWKQAQFELAQYFHYIYDENDPAQYEKMWDNIYAGEDVLYEEWEDDMCKLKKCWQGRGVRALEWMGITDWEELSQEYEIHETPIWENRYFKHKGFYRNSIFDC